jgi:hypothetical protein
MEQLTESLIVPFSVGVVIHLTFKSVLYPTAQNINYLIASTIISLRILGLYFSHVYGLCFGIGFLTSLILYRLFFSPLTSFRGPFLAKLTKLYQVYNMIAGNEYRRIRVLFETYDDDWVRIGPNELICRDPEAIKDIYLGPGEQSRILIFSLVCWLTWFFQMHGRKV